jgi:hypothetical protein
MMKTINDDQSTNGIKIKRKTEMVMMMRKRKRRRGGEVRRRWKKIG